jgi:glycosyltransferase involved in cell wall biosynthesis
VKNHLTSKRFCSGLDSKKVRLSKRALSATTLMQLLPRLQLNRYKDEALSRKAGLIAAKTESSLLCYSYYAFHAFKQKTSLLKHRFIFQLHPHPKTVRELLVEEMERVPSASASLSKEHELSLPQRDFDNLASEPHLANGWLAASSYTAKTLAENGIPREHIHVVPYGVDAEQFVARDRPPKTGEPFKIAYVGSMAQRKGLSYLLDAVRLLSSRQIKVVLYGRGIIDHELINHYRDIDLEINIGLPTEQVVRGLHKADVFVLPSLTEGFAHVVLEAMSCGLPVITTPNTCGPDVITHGEQGFIIPIRDVNALAEKLAWGLDNRDALAVMGVDAAQQARLFTWERFRAGVRNAYSRMILSELALTNHLIKQTS